MLRKPVWMMAEDEDSEGADEEEYDDPGAEGDAPGDDDEGDDEKDDADLDDKAKAALRRERDRVKELRRELKAARDAAKKDDDAEDAEAKAAAKWKPRVVNSAAKAAFLSAGAEKPERLLKLLDLDELDVTEKGEVDGLDEEVDRLRDEYPELFSTRRRGGRVETGDRSGKGTTKKPLSATEKQARAMTARAT
jgi:hypothetical protein